MFKFSRSPQSQPDPDKLSPLHSSPKQPAVGDRSSSDSVSRKPHEFNRSELNRNELKQAFTSCRQATLALVEALPTEMLCCQAHPDFSPVGWHLGHIAYTEALWVLERMAGRSLLFPHDHRLFAADGLPKAERQHLPDRQVIDHYLSIVRQQVFDYLDTVPLNGQERLWWFLLQHESQHCETIALILEMMRGDRLMEWCPLGLLSQTSTGETVTEMAIGSNPDQSNADMVYVPAGPFWIGNDAPYALDNEQPAHLIDLDGYWIDRYPVTCEDFRHFMEAGGYRNADWWSKAGWAWLQAHPVSQPLYWSDDVAWADHPVYGVNQYEAEAYARFVGKRLPTEAEWEKAACSSLDSPIPLAYPWGEEPPTVHHCNHFHWVGHTTPVTTYESSISPAGCVDMLGNVWEWTASLFEGYSGFKPYPYVGYSSTYYDGQHYVLRGGSWATRPWALRPSFRNWYQPWVRQIFAGFRCARD